MNTIMRQFSCPCPAAATRPYPYIPGSLKSHVLSNLVQVFAPFRNLRPAATQAQTSRTAHVAAT
jgi:hypothetical protein